MYYLKIINISRNFQLKNINQNQTDIVVHSVPLMQFLFFVTYYLLCDYTNPIARQNRKNIFEIIAFKV
jgi:hypothetical protein